VYRASHPAVEDDGHSFTGGSLQHYFTPTKLPGGFIDPDLPTG
jgi:hypothetical protein